jgi:hypothetical protein
LGTKISIQLPGFLVSEFLRLHFSGFPGFLLKDDSSNSAELALAQKAPDRPAACATGSAASLFLHRNAPHTAPAVLPQNRGHGWRNGGPR